MSRENNNNNNHNMLKVWKFQLFPTDGNRSYKPTEFFSLIKAIFILFAVGIVSLSFYISFLNPTRPCFKCDTSPLLHLTHRKSADVIPDNDLHVDKTTMSHVVFGIGGSPKTWDNRRHYIELWWKPKVTRGFVWLEEKPNRPWPKTSPPYKISADTLRFKYDCWYGSRSALHIARIVKETLELGLDDVRWFALGDDDTVYFVENLVSVLNKYDHNQMYYIGVNSESVEQDLVHSYTMAYGGGGIVISYALAVELVRVLDGCLDRYASFYGSDQKIQGCLSEIGVPLTKELGFHQIDIRGSAYGILAAHPIAPLVTLHHLDYVQNLFPSLSQIDSLKKLRSAYELDPGRTLQHSFCYDLKRNWSISVSWGYTVMVYPWLLSAKDLETPILTFQSWKSYNNEPFTFNTRVASSNPCERPILYFLDSVGVDGSSQILTSYKRFSDPSGIECTQSDYAPALAVQFVNISATTLSPDIWKLAPRRQCCEIINGGNGLESRMEVKVRGCNAFESVTPP